MKAVFVVKALPSHLLNLKINVTDHSTMSITLFGVKGIQQLVDLLQITFKQLLSFDVKKNVQVSKT